MSQSGGRLVVVALVGLVIVAAAAYWLGARVKSREQAAAEAEPPPRSRLTAVVERRVLVDSIVARAAVVPEVIVDVFAPAVPEGSQPVVTSLPLRPGSAVVEGSVVVGVAARPVFVFTGTIPAYRDMRPGDRGSDVVQLQASLARLGFDPGPGDGVFGPLTARAVVALYRRHGYEPVLHQPGGPEGLAEATARAAAAVAALTAARADGDPEAIAAAQEEARVAEQAKNDLEVKTGPMIPFGEAVFMPASPVRLEALRVAVGQRADGAVATLAGGSLRLEARLSPADQALVQIGQRATAEDQTGGASFDASVVAIGAEAEPPSADATSEETSESISPDARPVLILAADAPIEADLIGRNLRLTILRAGTQGEVLVVPVAAVSAGADGKESVVRIDERGRELEVVVRAGFSADGFVEVQPVSGALAEGDEVVVGR